MGGGNIGGGKGGGKPGGGNGIISGGAMLAVGGPAEGPGPAGAGAGPAAGGGGNCAAGGPACAGAMSVGAAGEVILGGGGSFPGPCGRAFSTIWHYWRYTCMRSRCNHLRGCALAMLICDAISKHVTLSRMPDEDETIQVSCQRLFVTERFWSECVLTCGPAGSKAPAPPSSASNRASSACRSAMPRPPGELQCCGFTVAATAGVDVSAAQLRRLRLQHCLQGRGGCWKVGGGGRRADGFLCAAAQRGELPRGAQDLLKLDKACAAARGVCVCGSEDGGPGLLVVAKRTAMLRVAACARGHCPQSLFFVNLPCLCKCK